MERKWQISRIEKYAEKWFAQNGFSFELVKQYVSKTIYLISKDGISEKFELPSEATDIKGYMELFRKSFELEKQIDQMKEQLAEKGICI